VVAGFTQDDGITPVLARYDSEGLLDSSFSGDGRLTTDVVGFRAVAVQADGRIVVAGSDEGSTGEDFAVTRHNVDGSLDSSFSGNGRVTTDFAGGPDAASAVAVQADGKIFAAGSSDQGATGVDFALARYEVTGAPDTTSPNTTITGGPSATTTDSTPTFAFISNEGDSVFECRVDTGAFAPCSSPGARATLANGPHTFQVRATDQTGNNDPSPAMRSFTSRRARPPRRPAADQAQAAVRRRSILRPSQARSPRAPPDPRPRGAFNVPRQSVDCTGRGPDCAVTTSVSGSVSTARRRKVKLGGSSFKVTAGKKGKVRVKLTRKGLKLLKRKKKVKAKITITVKRGATTTKKTVTCTLKAPKRRRTSARSGGS